MKEQLGVSGIRIFLSHSGVDSKAAMALVERIENSARGREVDVRAWIDKRDMVAGTSWQQQIEKAINQSSAFLIYVGSRGIQNWVEREVRLGLAKATGPEAIPFIPILSRHADLNQLPGFAKQHQCVHDVEGQTDQFEKLLDAIFSNEALSKEGVVEPFVGLKAFREKDSHLFFGRSQELSEVIEKLKRTSLLLITGDSGSGKSSLVKAGVIPAWRGSSFASLHEKEPDSSVWHVIQLSPGTDVFGKLASSLGRSASDVGKSAEDINTYQRWVWGLDPIRNGSEQELPPRDIGFFPQTTIEELAEALQQTSPVNAKILIYIDQFEELLTQCPEQQRPVFLKVLNYLSVKDVKVVATMRSDYYNLLSVHEDIFNKLENRDKEGNQPNKYRLKRISDQGLREAITEPLALANAVASDAFVNKMVDDLGDAPADLALAEFTLTECWSRRAELGAGDMLTTYVQLGGISGALATVANEVFTRLLETQKREAESLLLRLVRLGETGGAVRREVSINELSHDQWKMAQNLARVESKRLLQITGEAGEEIVQISHEQLVSQWPMYQQLLYSAAKNGKRIHERLIRNANTWLASGKNKRYLYRSESDMEAIRKLEVNQSGWLNRIEHDFIKNSLAEEQEEKNKKRRQARKLKLLVGAIVLSILAALAVVTSLLMKVQNANELAKNQLIINWWTTARGLVAEGEYVKARHFNSKALSASQNHNGYRNSMHISMLDPPAALRVMFKHEFAVTGAVFSSSEDRILSWSRFGGVLHLWDASTGKQIGSSMNPMIRGAVFSSSEDRILSWSYGWNDGGYVRLWSASNRTQIGSSMKHKGSINGAIFSNSEDRILSWSTDGSVRLWDASSGARIGSSMRHEASVKGAIFSSSEDRILSWSDDGSVRLWNASNGVRIGSSMQHERSVRGAVFSNSEDRILSWSGDGSVRLWIVSSGAQIGSSMWHEASVKGAVFSNSEDRILSWSDDGSVRLWDVSTGVQIGLSMEHGAAVNGAIFSGSEDRIVSWSDDGSVRLWDVSTGVQIGLSMEHGAAVNGAIFSSSEGRILSWSDNGNVFLWDAFSGEKIGSPIEHKETVNGAIFSSSEDRILSWSDDGYMRLWDVSSAAKIGSSMEYEAAVYGAAFSSSEDRILSWSDDSIVHLWDVSGRKKIGSIMKHKGSINGAIFSNSEDRILSWSTDGSVRLWDASSGARIGSSMRHEASVKGAIFSSSEDRILSWSDDGSVRLWNASNGAQIGLSMEHEERGTRAIFSSSGDHILSWTNRGSVRLWDASSGTQIDWPLWHFGTVTGAVLSSSGDRILSWTNRGSVDLWDVSGRKKIGSSEVHEEVIRGAVFSSSEDRIVSWSDDGNIRIWNASSGAATYYKPVRRGLEQIGSSLKHGAAVRSAIFSSSEDRILSWSDDGALRLWDVFSGAQIGSFMEHKVAVKGAIFSSSDDRILSWSDDGTVRIWDASSGAEIGSSMKHKKTVYGAVFSNSEDRILSWGGDGKVRLWNLPGDLDFPYDLLLLEQEAISGTRLNDATNELEQIPAEEWKMLRGEWLHEAKKHSEVCRYRSQNVYLKFYGE